LRLGKYLGFALLRSAHDKFEQPFPEFPLALLVPGERRVERAVKAVNPRGLPRLELILHAGIGTLHGFVHVTIFCSYIGTTFCFEIHACSSI
jgi:hypothetical protein